MTGTGESLTVPRDDTGTLTTFAKHRMTHFFLHFTLTSRQNIFPTFVCVAPIFAARPLSVVPVYLRYAMLVCWVLVLVLVLVLGSHHGAWFAAARTCSSRPCRR